MEANPRLTLEGPGFAAEAELLADLAPKTVAALLQHLPITDRTIQTRWSGNAWRSERNHEPTSPEGEIENLADHLGPGDIIYYPGYHYNLLKVGIAYGDARWLGRFCQLGNVSLIGHIDVGLDDFVRVSSRIIFDGPFQVTMSEVK